MLSLDETITTAWFLAINYFWCYAIPYLPRNISGYSKYAHGTLSRKGTRYKGNITGCIYKNKVNLIVLLLLVLPTTFVGRIGHFSYA